MSPVGLPWWASLYLGLFALVAVAGAYEAFPRSRAISFLSLLSFCFVTLLVSGFFMPPVAHELGWWALPITVTGLGWEFFSAVNDMDRAGEELHRDIALTDGERDIVCHCAMLINAVLVVPGYMAGLKLSYDLIAGVLGAHA